MYIFIFVSSIYIFYLLSYFPTVVQNSKYFNNILDELKKNEDELEK